MNCCIQIHCHTNVTAVENAPDVKAAFTNMICLLSCIDKHKCGCCGLAANSLTFMDVCFFASDLLLISGLFSAGTTDAEQPLSDKPTLAHTDSAADTVEEVRDISSSYKDGPTQPVLSSYKKTTVGAKVRCFASHWYSRYLLIDYLAFECTCKCW